MSAPRKHKTCLQCGRDFKPSKSRVKFCSHNCHDVSRELLTAQKIKQLACAGETQCEIARQLGVSRATTQRAIKKYGFDREWRELRYA
jgi:DNA invertase Pin-like site-specific DNA recombinase